MQIKCCDHIHRYLIFFILFNIDSHTAYNANYMWNTIRYKIEKNIVNLTKMIRQNIHTPASIKRVHQTLSQKKIESEFQTNHWDFPHNYVHVSSCMHYADTLKQYFSMCMLRVTVRSLHLYSIGGADLETQRADFFRVHDLK